MIKDSFEKEIGLLLDVLPAHLKTPLAKHTDLADLIEVIMDLGKPPEARFTKDRILQMEKQLITQDDIHYVTSKVGQFTSDNRAGIERTLHRISAMRNRQGKIIGLTLRFGRAIFGTIDIIRDVIESGQNILFLGPPGIGKTTKLREASRVLADEFNKRVVVVDTSNEIGGDGDVPHPGIGRARRMQVESPSKQHQVMIEAVENHMPQVIVVDEIGTEAEASAARTIAERGVQLIGTAHGNSIENLISNPTLSDLIGGIQSVILGDEEAKRRHTKKSVLERKAPPTFGVCVEIMDKNVFAIYHDVAKTVDAILQERKFKPEIRVRTKQGIIEVKQKAEEAIPEPSLEEAEEIIKQKGEQDVRIYPFGVHRSQLERGIRALGISASIVNSLDGADLVLTVKSKAKPNNKIVKAAEEHQIPIHVIKRNVSSQINKFLKFYFGVGGKEVSDDEAISEAEEAIEEVKNTFHSVDLSPQNAYIRRLQHRSIQTAGLRSESIGEEPKRRVRIYPS
ncbi:MAG: AAA family ATPase [Candidatus Saganbacteria bacterium]|nr:AAA family ATPase [Candidatus Saganbacteria bacterium]